MSPRIEDPLSDVPAIRRQVLVLRPDAARVLVRPFRPTIEPRDLNPMDKTRVHHIIDHVLALDPVTLEQQLADVLDNFRDRHRNLIELIEVRAQEMSVMLADHAPFNELQRRLVGAYFLQEYSYEASALFNPSIVPDPDQSTAPPGGLRFILSLRAVGEGHVSSLTFRSGTILAGGDVAIDPPERLACIPDIIRRNCGHERICTEVAFSGNGALSERVIFPVTDSQSNGIEDARFVQFQRDNGPIYYATYTAYSGRAIRSELIETVDFINFRMTPLTGNASGNKGMALFPRQIDGRFAMIGRQDNENLHLLYSDDLYRWDDGVLILKPQFPWEFIQIGNCGSPIELDEGWLLLTHGVGALRKYAIGAALLDKTDPSKVLGRTSEPLIRPDPLEREGYVPNVVYTCGAIRHGPYIILPYAVSDTFTRFITVEIAHLLGLMGVAPAEAPRVTIPA